MKNFFKISAIVILAAIALFIKPFGVSAQDSEQFNVFTTVVPEVSCNYNGICEPALGENEISCFNDCGCNNNGVCEPQRMEDESNCPNDCKTAPSGGGAGGGIPETKFYIKNLEIGKITFDSAEISWQTNIDAVCSTYLGKTTQYETGIISETSFVKSHLSVLTDLFPSTAYHFNIVCNDVKSLTAQTADKYFATLSVISNVNNFSARAGEKEIFLNWENPDDINFQSVKLIKNENFYPAGINDGLVLYEGTAESFIDKNVKIGKLYYYAIFAKGKNGSFSSGALASAQIQPAEIPVTPVTPQIKKLKLSDFDFYSNGIKIPVIDEKTIEPEANRQLIISIDYGKVPDAYKKIFIELNAGDSKFYYLFASNRDKSVYSVSLVSPLLLKNYPFKINFLDENNKIISELNGELAVWSTQMEEPESWIFIFIRNNKITIFLLIILILLIILLFILEKRRRKK
jgi:hypothetical protein